MRHVRAIALDAPAELEVNPAGDGRTITVRVVSWNTDYRVSDDGRRFYRERYAPGGLNARPGALVIARAEHDPQIFPDRQAGFTSAAGVTVGRVVATRIEPDGLDADVRIFNTRDGDDLLELVNERIVRHISPEFDDDEHELIGADPVIERTNAELVGLAFTLHPQYGDARVLAVRSQPTPEHHQETTTMKRRRNPDGSFTVVDDAGNEIELAEFDSPGTDTPDDDSDNTSGERSDDELVGAGATTAAGGRSTPVSGRTAPRPGATPSSGGRRSHFRSMGHYAQAVALGQLGDPTDERRQRFARALATATTADAAGLLGEVWVPEIIDLYRTLTPSVQMFRQRPLPDTGMVINQPIVTQRPIVNEIPAELTDLGAAGASQKMIVGNASWAVKTYGGGNNVSLQTIMRTEPSYLDELFRLWVREMALDVNLDVATALYAAANDTNAALEYVDAAGFDELIIDASAVFLDTLYRPAEVALFSVDLWSALAKAKDANDHPLYPTVNPMNRSGTLSATSTSGNIVNVEWAVEPALGGVGAGIKAVVGLRDAWVTATSPMGTLAADVPSSLSRDNAVYEFAAFGATDTTGLVQIANAV